MKPEFECGDIYIDGVLAMRLFPSVGRPGASCDGYAMWSFNSRPLGWVADGSYLIECVVAAHLIHGELDPAWEGVKGGAKLIHPRYTVSVERTRAGWLPKIVDEASSRAHSLKPRPTKDEAVNVIDNLLRRRVGRVKPIYDWQWFLEQPAQEGDFRYEFQQALRLIAPDIGALVHDRDVVSAPWTGERENIATKIASCFSERYKTYFDPVPFLGTRLADYIKSALIDLYRGSNSIVTDAGGSMLMFSSTELAAFRDRFRRAPISDRKYLDFVNDRFVAPLQRLCPRGKRWPNGPIADKKSYQPKLHPRRDRNDFLLGWPVPAGSRLKRWGMVTRPS